MKKARVFHGASFLLGGERGMLKPAHLLASYRGAIEPLTRIQITFLQEEKSPYLSDMDFFLLAEREGFEPSRDLHPLTI